MSKKTNSKKPNPETPIFKKSKASLVKSHLLKKKHITSWEAITLYKATRLSAIIFNLRSSGYNIATQPLKSKGNGGNTVTYAKYVLVSEPKRG